MPGIQSIVLGGSRARATNSPSSDIDIGIYYDGWTLDIDTLNKATQMVDDEYRENLIAPQEDGANGLTAVAIIEEGRSGVVTAHYQTGHPHAYINVMYMDELAVSKVLWESLKKV